MEFKTMTVEQLIAAAAECSRPSEYIENNFAANVIMLTENPGASPHFAEITAIGEKLLLQIAFLARGHNPTCGFIADCYNAGWRNRGGFRKA